MSGGALSLGGGALSLGGASCKHALFRKVKGGYRWGSKGKVYKTKAEAEKQGRAIRAAGYKGKK